jgi:phospholipid/cholesterol/gamma-HCH transport system permease protein
MAPRISAVRPLHAASHSIVTRSVNVAYRTHDRLEMFGQILFFVVKVVAYIPYTFRHFRREIWRQLGDITFGSRMLAVAASTVVVATLITAIVGVNLGISGLQGLNILGLGALAGALSSFGNTRELAPLLTAFGLAAQMGCRFTAQLGAMRVAEEIDALEVMSIPSLPYLITTRLIAALMMVIPLYLFALSGAFLASQITVLFISKQGSGTYLHYFYLFLSHKDVLLSVVKVIVFCFMITIVHCYYGYTASGGPEGVGRAAGRAIRTSTVLIALTDMLMTVLFWGVSVPVKVTG